MFRIQIRHQFIDYANSFQRASGTIQALTHSYMHSLGAQLNIALQKNTPRTINNVTIHTESKFQIIGASNVTTITLRGKPLQDMTQLAQAPEPEVDRALDPRARRDGRQKLEATQVNGELMVRRKPKPQPEINIDYHVKTLKDTRGLRGKYASLILRKIASMTGR